MKSYERREKVSKAIQRELGNFIQQGGVKDDRLDQFISIVDVSLNNALSSAKITYSILSSDEDKVSRDLNRTNTQAALVENAGYIRGVIGRKLNLRYAPKFIFVSSDSLSQSVDMVDLIDRTVNKDEQNIAERDDG